MCNSKRDGFLKPTFSVTPDGFVTLHFPKLNQKLRILMRIILIFHLSFDKIWLKVLFDLPVFLFNKSFYTALSIWFPDMRNSSSPKAHGSNLLILWHKLSI